MRQKLSSGFETKIRNGKPYYWMCKPCYRLYTSNHWNANKDRVNARRSKKRAEHPEYAIVADCKKADKLHGRGSNDLTAEFVRSKIAMGCVYCGATEMRITLDRIDNALARNQSNIVPCCIRCNYTRGSMPYAAGYDQTYLGRSAFEIQVYTPLPEPLLRPFEADPRARAFRRIWSSGITVPDVAPTSPRTRARVPDRRWWSSTGAWGRRAGRPKPHRTELQRRARPC